MIAVRQTLRGRCTTSSFKRVPGWLVTTGSPSQITLKVRCTYRVSRVWRRRSQCQSKSRRSAAICLCVAVSGQFDTIEHSAGVPQGTVGPAWTWLYLRHRFGCGPVFKLIHCMILACTMVLTARRLLYAQDCSVALDRAFSEVSYFQLLFVSQCLQPRWRRSLLLPFC